MRLRRLAFWGCLAASPAVLLGLKSCGFAARIDVIQSFHDSSEYVTYSRCGGGQSVVDILYVLLNTSRTPMTGSDPLFAGAGDTALSVSVPEPLQIAGQAATVSATVVATQYEEITALGRARGVSLVMDNSQSLNGFDEDTGTRITLTDPLDNRIAGAQNFVNNGLTSSDAATVISFHGIGDAGVDPKLRQVPGESPSQAWFTPNQSVLSDELAELKNEETGKTPLYKAIGVGAQALRTLDARFRPVMVLFSDGPDNSSDPMTFNDAVGSVAGDPQRQIPVIAIGLGSLLGPEEGRLRQIACATTPKGAFLKANQAGELERKFELSRHLLTGYWRTTLNLTVPQGLPSGTHTVSGKMFADPQGTPKMCDATAAQPCGQHMACDTGTNRCYMTISFTITVP